MMRRGREWAAEQGRRKLQQGEKNPQGDFRNERGRSRAVRAGLRYGGEDKGRPNLEMGSAKWFHPREECGEQSRHG